MEWIQELNLTSKEKKKIEMLIKESEITDIRFVQRNIYLFLRSSKIILLKNSTEMIYKKLKEIIEKDLIPKEYEQKINKKKADEWTEEELWCLKHEFYKTELESLSIKLNKSQYQISLKVIELGMVNSGSWDDDEVKYLEENQEISNYELAKTLKRSISSIKAKKRVLKIRKGELDCELVKKI